MKIAVWHDLPRGGALRALRDQLGGLLKRDHTVRSWSPDDAAVIGLPAVPEHRIPVVARGSSFRQLNTLVSPSLSAAFKSHCDSVADEMRQWAPDVVFAASSLRLGAGPIAISTGDVPSVLYLQEPARYLYEDMGRPPWRADPERPSTVASWVRPALTDLRRGQRARLLARDEQAAAQAFDRILVNSRFSREAVLRAYGLDAHICRLGVDHQRLVSTKCARSDFVIAVGELASHKRPQLAVDAVRLSQFSSLVWVAHLVDDSVLQSLNVNGISFDLMRDVSDGRLADLLSRASVLIVTSRLEPFGLTPIEAGLCRTPTVAVAEGGIRETIRSGITGLLVDGGKEQLGRALDQLHGDDDLIQRMGRAAKDDYRRRFDPEVAIDQLEAHLLSTASG